MAQRVLVFESDEQLASKVKNGLESLGATVEVVDNGPAGLELAEQQKPDLILLTIELPGMNGFLVCKKIKKHPELQSIPLIVLSSEATEETFEQHRKLRTRADDYLHKPVELEEILRHVQRFVDIAKPVDEAAEIEVSGEEPVVVEDAEQAASHPPSNDAAQGQEAGFDAEVEAFADSAFDALVIEEDDNEPTRLAPRDRISSVPASPSASSSPPASATTPPEPSASTLPESPAASTPPPLPSSRPPGPSRSSAPPTPAPASSPPTQSASPSQAERAAGASQSGRPAVSNREYLELREQLHKKEREILDLKDQIAQRDKQLLESRDAALGYERQAADAQDRLFEVERELSEANERIAGFDEETAAAGRRASELEQRVRELETEVEAQSTTAAHQRERFDEELQQKLAQAEQSNQAALEALRSELEETHAQNVAAMQQDLEERQRAAQALEQERDGLEAEVARLKQEAESAVEARDTATAELSRVRHQVAELESRIERAHAKIQHDEQLLERARKAMAIGMSLLEDQQQNQLDPAPVQAAEPARSAHEAT